MYAHLINGVSTLWISYDKLGEFEQKLINLAVKVRKNAQAPITNYLVGATVVAESDEITVGCNVERCTLSQTTHAEQNAVDSMIASFGPKKIQAVVIVGGRRENNFDTPLVAEDIKTLKFDSFPCPCGHCLQIIWENCKGDPKIPIYGVMHGLICLTRIGDLLPGRFGPESLGYKV